MTHNARVDAGFIFLSFSSSIGSCSNSSSIFSNVIIPITPASDGIGFEFFNAFVAISGWVQTIAMWLDLRFPDRIMLSASAKLPRGDMHGGSYMVKHEARRRSSFPINISCLVNMIPHIPTALSRSS